MQLDWIEGLGLVAGAVGAFAFAPQAVKLVRTGDGAAVSGLTYTMVLAGALMWMTYGAFREAPSIVLWNLVAAALAATVLGLKLFPRTPRPSA